MSVVPFDDYEESKFLRKAKENPFVPVGEETHSSGHDVAHSTQEGKEKQFYSSV